MKKNCLVKTLVLVIATFSIFCNVTYAFCNENKSEQLKYGNWLYVGGTGPGNYTCIQDALDNATDGDTIFVYSGSYYEDILIEKEVSLQGQDKTTTNIGGAGDINDTVTINSDYVRISNFTLKNEEPYTVYSVIIFAQTNYSYIVDNLFIGHDTNGALFSSIYMVGSNHNIISGNTFSKGVIRAWYHCNHNEISYNIIDSSITGISLFFSYYNTLTHNIINGAKESAIVVSMSGYDDISYNTLRNCKCGLTLYANHCNITYNNFIHVLKKTKIDSSDNLWDNNYWGRPRFLPKLIITFDYVNWPPGVHYIEFHYGIDWHPAKEPYDIPIGV